jgi:hypothetical protein
MKEKAISRLGVKTFLKIFVMALPDFLHFVLWISHYKVVSTG